jgi:hypothetical protein
MRSLRLLEILADPGPGAALQFLERVHGPLRPEDGISADLLDSWRMPGRLRDFYARAGGRFSGGQNEFLTPAKPDRLKLWGIEPHQGDKLIFYVENQHVFEWATAVEGDDPPVWHREPGSEKWEEERAPLSVFILQALLLHSALYHDPAGAWRDSDVGADELARLKAGLVEVPHGPFTPFQERFFAGDDIVLMVDPANWAYICASGAEALSALSLDPEAWDMAWPPEGNALEDRLTVVVERQDGTKDELEFWLGEDGTEQRWEPTGEPSHVVAGDILRVADELKTLPRPGRLDAVILDTRPSMQAHGPSAHLNAGSRYRPRPTN